MLALPSTQSRIIWQLQLFYPQPDASTHLVVDASNNDMGASRVLFNNALPCTNSEQDLQT